MRKQTGFSTGLDGYMTPSANDVIAAPSTDE
jgi:hypothetical protein